MLSKPKLKQNDDPHDVLVVAPDVALVVPTDEELSKLAHTLRNPSAPQICTGSEIRTGSELPAGATVPPVDATFRPSVGDVRAPGARRAARVFTVALLLAVCAGAADFAWQSYGDVARQMIDQWTPQRILTMLLPLKESAPSAQPTASAAAEPVPANTAPPPSQAPVQAAAQPEAPGSTYTASHRADRCRPIGRILRQSLSAMAHDLANAGQEIEQLKASIEQLKGSIEQLTAGQQQISRDIAKASEQNKVSEQNSAAEDFTAPTAAGRGTQAAAAFATAGDVSSDTDASRPALRATATRTAAARHGRPAGRSGLGVGAAAANAAALGDNANGNSYKHRQNSRGFRSGRSEADSGWRGRQWKQAVWVGFCDCGRGRVVHS